MKPPIYLAGDAISSPRIMRSYFKGLPPKQRPKRKQLALFWEYYRRHNSVDHLWEALKDRRAIPHTLIRSMLLPSLYWDPLSQVKHIFYASERHRDLTDDELLEAIAAFWLTWFSKMALTHMLLEMEMRAPVRWYSSVAS